MVIKMERQLIEIICPNCHKKQKNLFLGEGSYIQVKCPKCIKTYFLKTDKKGKIKTGTLN